MLHHVFVLLLCSHACYSLKVKMQPLSRSTPYVKARVVAAHFALSIAVLIGSPSASSGNGHFCVLSNRPNTNFIFDALQ